MSIIRLGLLAGLAIMLLPADELRQAELSGAASQTAHRTATFCERNPSTCQAGREMWSLFLKKAEFGMELTAGLARDYMARGREPAQAQPQTQPAPARPASSAQPAMSAGVRIEPAHTRGTLTRADLDPQWRGSPAR